MTNLEYIRTLSVKELVKIGIRGTCECCVWNDDDDCSGECANGFVKWLKQESEKPDPSKIKVSGLLNILKKGV